MGECGCGDFSPYASAKIGDQVLAVEIYRGCEYCNTGIMVSLYVFTPDEAKRWNVNTDEEFKPDQFGSARMDFPLIGPDDLVAVLEEMEGVDFDLNDYGDIVSVFKDFGLEILQRALKRRLAEVEQNQESR